MGISLDRSAYRSIVDAFAFLKREEFLRELRTVAHVEPGEIDEFRMEFGAKAANLIAAEKRIQRISEVMYKFADI